MHKAIIELLTCWVSGAYPTLAPNPEEFCWFVSKRANNLIGGWLMSKRMAALEPVSPTSTGCIVVSRERVEHVYDSRTTKDNVAQAGVVELLGQLLVFGHPKYAPNPGYPMQLLMFDPAYKAIDPAAKGESPVAAVEFCGDHPVCLRLATAYWAKPAKIRALELTALKK